MKYRYCNLGRFLFILWQVKELALVLLKTFMLWHYLSAYAESKRSFVNILGRKNVHLLADYLYIYLSSLNSILLFLLFDFLFLISFIDFLQWYITVFFLLLSRFRIIFIPYFPSRIVLLLIGSLCNVMTI